MSMNPSAPYDPLGGSQVPASGGNDPESQLVALDAELFNLETSIRELETKDLARARRALQKASTTLDATGNVDADAIAAAKTLLDSAQAKIDALRDDRTAVIKRRHDVLDAAGKLDTPEKKEASAAEIRKSESDADKSYWEAQNSALDYEIALAKANGEPTSELERRKGENQARLDEANAISQELQNQIDTVYAPILAELGAREAEATVISAESQATRDEAMAQYAAQFAKAEADIQSGNATWQEIKNRMALVEEETQRILFDAGMPQNEIDQAFEDLKSKQIANEQTEAGPDATAVKQIKAAIKRGDMDPVAATEKYYEVAGYGTPLERRQEGRANAMALNQSAISAGLYGPPGGLDAGGNLSRALQGVGIDYTPTPGKQMELPQWAQSLGVDISAQQGVPSQPVFDEQGEMLPRAAFAQSLLPPPQVNMTPDELTAWVAGRKGEQPAPVSQTQAQAAVASPDAAGGTSGGKGTTKVTLPDGTVIEAGAGPPAEPAPPPPTHEDRGADDWWAGVTANPVLSAAAKYGEMQNAEAHPSKLSKVTYVDGSVRWFDPQGQETTEPRMAEPAAAAPAAATTKPVAPVQSPESYVPTSPQVGPYPQYPVGPSTPRPRSVLPGFGPADPRDNPDYSSGPNMGMYKFGPQPPPTAMPRFARSLMFAGGR